MLKNGLSFLFLWILANMATLAGAQSVTIKTTTIIDGKGQVLRNQEIVVENGKIARIDAASHKPDIDLSGLTVTPGWIDTHAHPGWYFDKDGRYDPGGRNSKTTPQEGALRTEANAYATLMGGFTTIQSLGQPIDVPFARPDRAGRAAGSANSDRHPTDHRNQRHAGTDSRAGAPTQAAGRGRDQAVRDGQHPRWRQDDDDEGAD